MEPVLSLSLVVGAVGAAGAALSAHQSEMASIFPVFFGAVCLSLAAFSVSNALLCGDELARAWAFVIPLHPLPLTALLWLVPADDLLRAKESMDSFRVPGTVLVGAIGAVTATMPRPLRWKCMVVAGFLLSTASNFGVATYLLDERLSFIYEMFPYHLSTLGSLALTLLCQKVIKELIGQQIMVRAATDDAALGERQLRGRWRQRARHQSLPGGRIRVHLSPRRVPPPPPLPGADGGVGHAT